MREIHPHIVIDETALAESRAHAKRLEVIHSPFVVFSMPRSRSAWLSHFLTYGDWHCGHDELRHMRSLDDVKAWLSQGNTGTVETAAAPFWRLLPEGARVVTIRRPVAEVVDSFMAIPGCTFDAAELDAVLTHMDRKLDQIESRLACMSIDFAELENEAACAALFEYCLSYPHNTGRWRAMAPVNIQINMPALIRYCEAFRPALEKLASVATHKMRANLVLQKPVEAGGITIQTESFENWLKDARALFDEHLVQVGEAPGDWQRKNLPLMAQLYGLGAMQITTARLNGRMFGYLMTLISPSLGSEGITTATHTTFFADQQFPGLGMKLQREALRSLKARGVDEVFWEAGQRGSGPRMGTMYRRLGGVEHSQTYRLALSGNA